MTKQELQKTIDELVQLGEDREEFDFWLEAYDELAPDKQIEFNKIVLEELEQLKKNQAAS